MHVHPPRLRGPTAARRAAARAGDAGWPVWCGSAAVTGGGLWGGVAWAGTGGVRGATVGRAVWSGAGVPGELPGAGGRSRDLVGPPVGAEEGVVPVPLAESGLGHDVDRAALSGFTARTLVLGARAGKDPGAAAT